MAYFRLLSELFMDLAIILCILFVAALANTTFGFGFPLIAVPLLSMMLDVQEAAPLVIVTTVIVAIFILIREWRMVDFASLKRLVPSALFGIPFGIWFLTTIPEQFVARALGTLLISYGLYRLLSRIKLADISTKWAYLFGFFGGMLGSACGISGPPVVLYGSFRQWPQRHFRATVQAFLLLSGLLIALSHAMNGLWDATLWQRAGWAVPVLALSTVIGNYIAKTIPADKFSNVIFVVFIVLGCLLWLK